MSRIWNKAKGAITELSQCFMLLIPALSFILKSGHINKDGQIITVENKP